LSTPWRLTAGWGSSWRRRRRDARAYMLSSYWDPQKMVN
jgi:hypothetical protein